MMGQSTKARTKSALLLIGTLLLGMVLGALLHARLVDERMERIAHLRSPRGFTGFFEGAITPHSPEQQEAIREILDRSAAQMAEASRERRGEIRRIIHATQADLAEVLTEAQNHELERLLEERRAERRERMKQRRAKAD